MSVDIRLYGQLREAAGAKSVSISVDDETTLGELLEILIAEYPETKALLLDEGTLASRTVIRINRTTVDTLDATVDDTDRVAIAMQVVGGAT